MYRRWKSCLASALLLLGTLAAAGGMHPLAGQSALDWDPRGAELGRTELEALLQRLEAAASSPGYSESLRERAREEAEVVRTRLEEGDFQVGDRVVLRVEGEPALSDTIPVAPGRVLQLPDMDAIPLRGVLRSELEPHLDRELRRYLQDPVVHAHSLIRIAVLGHVGRQGFYTLPASLLVEEALMAAGGPAGSADLDETEIVRGDEVIWSGEALQQAFIAGRTLDQLSLRAGDRIIVPERVPGLFERGIVRTLLVTVPGILFLISRFL